MLSLEEQGVIDGLNSSGKYTCKRYYGTVYLEEMGYIYNSVNLIHNNFNEGENYNIIIGMNIISQGNFSITRTNYGSQLLFAFSL